MKTKLNILLLLIIFIQLIHASTENIEVEHEGETATLEQISDQQTAYLNPPFNAIVNTNETIKFQPLPNKALKFRSKKAFGYDVNSFDIILKKDGEITTQEENLTGKINRVFSNIESEVDTIEIRVKKGKFLFKVDPVELIADLEINVADEVEQDDVEMEVISAENTDKFNQAINLEEPVDTNHSVITLKMTEDVNISEYDQKFTINNEQIEDIAIVAAADDKSEKLELESNLPDTAIEEDLSTNEISKPIIDSSIDVNIIDKVTAVESTVGAGILVDSQIKSEAIQTVEKSIELIPGKLGVEVDEKEIAEKIEEKSFSTEEIKVSSKDLSNETIPNQLQEIDQITSKIENEQPMQESTQKGIDIQEKDLQTDVNMPEFKDKDLSVGSELKSENTLPLAVTNAIAVQSEISSQKAAVPNFAQDDKSADKKIVEDTVTLPSNVKQLLIDEKSMTDISSEDIKPAQTDVKIILPEEKQIDKQVEIPDFTEKDKIVEKQIDEPEKIVNIAVNDLIVEERNMQKVIEETEVNTSVFDANDTLEVAQKDIDTTKAAKEELAIDGTLKIYTLKTSLLTPAWIKVYKSNSGKLFTNSDTLYENPKSLQLPPGAYDIEVIDKKIVPPLVMREYSVVVNRGEVTEKKVSFAQGTLKVKVLKNGSLAASHIFLYDKKSNKRVAHDITYQKNPAIFNLSPGKYQVVIEDRNSNPVQSVEFDTVNVTADEVVEKTASFSEGTLQITALKNSEPLSAWVKIFRSDNGKKVKTLYTDAKTGMAKIELTAGIYDVSVHYTKSSFKPEEVFKSIEIGSNDIIEKVAVFNEGDIKVVSKRKGKPLYVRVDVYRPKSKKRIYYEFSNKLTGVTNLKLPAGKYDIIVRDHNIKRKFKNISVGGAQAKTINVKF